MMPLMNRRLFTILSALSFLTGMATAGLWIKSYHYQEVTVGRGGSWTDWGVIVPHWLVVLLLSIFPAVWGVRVYRRRLGLARSRQLKLGLCPTCGYDLRASKDRSPECGMPISADLVRRPVA